MKEILQKIPKTTIATVSSAVIVYALSRGYIDGDTANLISQILVAFGLGVNLSSGKFSKK